MAHNAKFLQAFQWQAIEEGEKGHEGYTGSKLFCLEHISKQEEGDEHTC
jgi:hypothetical protein